MLWKIYFWATIILTLVGIIYGYGNGSVWTLRDWIDVASSILFLVGLYAYIWRKTIFSPDFWKLFFWFSVIDWALIFLDRVTPLRLSDTFFFYFHSNVSTYSTQEFLFYSLLGLPAVYAVYKLAYQKGISKKKR